MNEVLKTGNLSIKELIRILKTINNFNSFYNYKVRHYTLEQHTLLVIGEYIKHFSNVLLPISKNLFKFILAIHDIGKPRAFQEGNNNKQYLYSILLINEIRELLPFTDKEIDLCIALIEADPIGMYMQNQINIKDSVNQINEMHKKTILSKNDFFKLIIIYYQCDTASYTMDAGGLAFLEHLYEYKNNNKVFSNETMRLNFSPLYEIKYLKIEKSFLYD